jgi:hypothetical protein
VLLHSVTPETLSYQRTRLKSGGTKIPPFRTRSMASFRIARVSASTKVTTVAEVLFTGGIGW